MYLFTPVAVSSPLLDSPTTPSRRPTLAMPARSAVKTVTKVDVSHAFSEGVSATAPPDVTAAPMRQRRATGCLPRSVMTVPVSPTPER
jgi:hypothetical protein